VQLGLENKKKMIWALALAGGALLAVGYEVVPLFFGGSNAAASSPAVAPVAAQPASRPGKKQQGPKAAKKITGAAENLDPTLQLQLLASSEQKKYAGSERNIFVSQAEEVKIEQPKGTGATDHPQEQSPIYTPPQPPTAPPIPLKFFGFASGSGDARKIFLSKDQDVFIAGEGEIVDRRYKVVRITANSVDIEDLVVSGPAQTIPLTQSPS
jgi:hypothetical protein